jgi:hypothetical protein
MGNKQESILSTEARLLTFRMSRQNFLDLGRGHFLFGLVSTWIVGMGRYWDDPGAKLVQHLGLGSVIYIFVLSMFVWLVIWPLRSKQWSYAKVLTFVSLTSAPAILYAIPVERFFALETARSVNAWFLAIVATWRVALLIFFLRKYAQLGAFQIIVAACLPLTMIVTTLTALNLERAVFDLMGGLREGGGTANDTAYAVLFTLTYFSVILFVPLLLCYVGLVLNGVVERRAARMARSKDA